MVEPIATSGIGRPANDLGLPEDRFSHDLPTPDAVEAAPPLVAPEPALESEAAQPTDLPADAPADLPAGPVVEAARIAPRVDEIHAPVESAEPLPSPPRAPEWPPAWLRVVQPEPEPEPEPEPIVEPAPLEPAAEARLSPGEYAHAFGLTMAAALDHAAQANAAGPASSERPPVQRPLITRLPRSRPRADRPVVDGPAEGVPAETAAAVEAVDPAPAVATSQPPAPPLDVMDAPLFGSIGGTAARPPRPTRARRARLDETAEDRPDAAARTQRASERTLPGTVYLLYLTGFLVVPALLGVIVSLNAKRRAPAWLQSHYLFQIRTFWIGCAGVAVAVALAVSSLQATEFAGLALMMLLVLWMLLRAAAGYARLLKLQVHPAPRSWLI